MQNQPEIIKMWTPECTNLKMAEAKQRHISHNSCILEK